MLSTATSTPSHRPLAPVGLRVLVAVALTSLASPALAAETLPVVTVGVVVDGPEPPHRAGGLVLQRRVELLQTVAEQTHALTRRQFDVRFPEEKRLAGDWTLPGIRATVDRLLADPAVDVVVSLGVFATHDLAHRPTLPKPVVAAWALDAEAQRLPLEGGASGRKNLNYLVAEGSVARDLRKFREIAGLSTVHVIADRRILEGIPEIPAYAIAVGAELGLQLVALPGDRSAAPILESLPEEVEGIYLTPLPGLPEDEFAQLVDGLIARKLPSFSFLGQDEVERGILAGMRSSTDVSRLGRRIALNVQRILMGEDAGTLPVVLEQPARLTFNMATARAIGVFPSWRVLVEAIQIDREALERGRLLTFEQAVQEAVQANLALRATARAVAAGEENVARARASFLPRLDGSARGVRIDADRAEASFGSQAERSGTAGLALTQLVWSDAARANLRVARLLQDSLVWQRETQRLDVALAAASAYLDVLRAETLERIERDNLRLTESHLDLSRRREQLGAAGPADVYRWESQLATDRSKVITAQNRASAARVVLNRLLHRPLEEPFTTVAPGLDESWLVTCCDRLDPFVDTPALFALFRDFVVQEGLSNSLELRTVDSGIAAQERVVVAARRTYWSPEVGLRGEFDREFSRGGAGAEVPALPFAFAQADREDWSVALSATLPLFRGGLRAAELRQANEELAGLRIEREALAETIELRIRTALFAAGSTFPAIELAREAARAAHNNLELVADAYSRGAVSIIELLDAQSADLAAEEFASNAVYDFLLDLMEVQRAANSFDFFVSDRHRDEWFARLAAFFERAGVQVRAPERSEP